MHSLDRHHRQPELFEAALVEIPPLPAFPNVMPRPEHYGAIVVYLCWKVMRGERPSPPYTDLIDGTRVTRKDIRVPIIGSTALIREVRDTVNLPGSNLKRVYVGDRGLGTLEDPIAGKVTPRKFSVYDVRPEEVYQIILEDFPAGATDEEAYEAADLELVADRAKAGSLTAKHHMYLYLANIANMPPPPLRLVRQPES